MVEFMVANQAVILGFALATSELLAIIPWIKSNSIAQVVVNLAKDTINKFK
jgi:hypothetical protein